MPDRPRGAFVQRDKKTYAVVPRTPMGLVTPDILENIAKVLGDDSSALLFLVHPDGVQDTVELLSALTLFKGKIHRTTLLPQVEASIISN